MSTIKNLGFEIIRLNFWHIFVEKVLSSVLSILKLKYHPYKISEYCKICAWLSERCTLIKCVIKKVNLLLGYIVQFLSHQRSAMGPQFRSCGIGTEYGYILNLMDFIFTNLCEQCFSSMLLLISTQTMFNALIGLSYVLEENGEQTLSWVTGANVLNLDESYFWHGIATLVICAGWMSWYLVIFVVDYWSMNGSSFTFCHVKMVACFPHFRRSWRKIITTGKNLTELAIKSLRLK